MPFTRGSWNIGSINLPELGATETLGGKKGSLNPPIASYGPRQTAIGSKVPANMNYATPSKTSNVPRTVSKTSPSVAQKQIQETNNLAQEKNLQQKELENVYSGVMDYINRQRKALQGGKQQLMQIAASPYEQALPAIQAEGERAIQELGQTAAQTRQQRESALDQARRMYGELATRNLQMFGGGGASSVGQAAGEILSQEQARSMGSIQQQAQTQLSNIENQIANVNRERDVKMREINIQKNQALAQAELDFRDRLAQIDEMEYTTKQSKKIDKINLLREYRQNLSDTNRYFRELQNQTIMASNAAADQLNRTIEQMQQTSMGQPTFDINAPQMGVGTSFAPSGQYNLSGRRQKTPEEELYGAM